MAAVISEWRQWVCWAAVTVLALVFILYPGRRR
jgi:hypothetical protein